MAELLDKNKNHIAEVSMADTFLKKLLGLMFKKDIPYNVAHYFPGTALIHMFFMRFSIDVVYLKSIKKKSAQKKFKIVKIVKALKPWRISGSLKADSLLELKAGSTAVKKIKKNEFVFIKN
ncbi:MAG: DUF192 domain-containing protein [Elusimicrobiota bacterium]